MASPAPTIAIPPWFSLGFLVALIIAILAVLLFFLGRLPMEWALAIVAICSHRL